VLISDADYLCDFNFAVHEIFYFLSQKSNQGKMVIILSGLKADMTWLMSTWPILLAFFDEQMVFENIPPPDCIPLLLRELEASKIVPETSPLKDQHSNDFERVSRLFNVMQQLPGWCNARDIKQLARQILGMLLEESAGTITGNDSPEKRPPQLSLEIVTRCMKRRISQRRDQYVIDVSANKANPYSLLPPPLVPGSQPDQAMANPLGQRHPQQADGWGFGNNQRNPQIKIELPQRDDMSPASRQQATQIRRTSIAQSPVAFGLHRDSRTNKPQRFAKFLFRSVI
jgi:hypothetical protein